MTRTLQLIALLIAAATGCRSENRSTATNPVKWTVSDSSAELRVGSPATLRVAAAIDSGWYIYALTQGAGGPVAMSVSVAPSPPFRLEGSPTGPQPLMVHDKEFGIDTERYEGSPEFTIPVSLTAATTDPPQLDIKVRYQACNANFCLPARTTVLSTRVRSVNRT